MSTPETAHPGFRGVIAVDGPSGSGKSSVCRAVARQLGLRYLDTGAMYRAVTWAALDRGVDLADRRAVATLCRALVLDITTDPASPGIAVDGVDVTGAIRQTRISESVSAIATNLDVRADLIARQQAILAEEKGPGIIAEGRDITTVVAPDADVRLLLTADENARIARRARELHGTDDADALAATHAQVATRDKRDSTVVDFLAAADGVVEIDTSALTFDQVVATVLRVVSETAGAGIR
ncbi:(d)CMP kinase [Cryptosporangium aurantiacum]|uniref:Cytidylate kinase n=1 Tax=Cryptosporangium aurantiacum TaxID=134849 RepID=A0A1M7RP71_9ACTN|nr:(d)CMP kinase [Cryptosporangium aurantiacum]SHN47892.1 cytidylate kinase [Cryptosporangium aurantiacum]